MGIIITLRKILTIYDLGLCDEKCVRFLDTKTFCQEVCTIFEKSDFSQEVCTILEHVLFLNLIVIW